MKNNIRRILSVILVVLICFCSFDLSKVVNASEPKTIDELFSLEKLYDNNSGYQSYHASSYDLDGGNLDGLYFNKLENIQYTTTLLEVEGPGAITRFWAGGYSEHEAVKTIQIYVDGNLLIDCKASDFFNGVHTPFVKPYVGTGTETGGGVYCYVPIVFQESIKITGQYVNYYNIDYTLFPSDYVVTSTTITKEPVLPAWYKDNTHLLDVLCDGEITAEEYSLASGKSTTIYEDKNPGVLQGFNIEIKDLLSSTMKCPQFTEGVRTINVGGTVEFDMNLNPNNQGAYFKWRIDATWSNVVLDIYVDGEYIGRKSSGNSDTAYKFKDLFMEIPKNITAGKKEVNVKIVVVSVDGIDAPLCNFWMYSKLQEGTILTDYLDLLNGTNEAQNNLVYTNTNGSTYSNPLLDNDAYCVNVMEYDFQENADAISGTTKSLYFSNKSLQFDIKTTGTKDLTLIQRTVNATNQSVIVWVNGKKYTTWNIFGDNVGKVMESQFTIPASLLSGETTHIALVPSGECNIESLTVYENNTVVDSIKFSSDTTHSVTGVYEFRDAEYQGVNSLPKEWEDIYNKIKVAPDTHELLVNTYIRVYYDGKLTPDIDTSLAMLLGFGMYNYYKVESVVSGVTDDGILYFYLPMPYRSIKVELYRAEGTTSLNNFTVSTARGELDSDIDLNNLQLLKTQYTYYDSTKKNEAMNWLTAEGSGKLVGIELCMEGAKSFEYLEGDEVVTIDGNKSHILYGTGCEDIFNSAWYYVGGPFSQSMHGCTTATLYGTDRGRNATYRWFIMDQINFRDGIQATIEHGPQNLTSGEEVHMLAFYYHNENSYLTELYDVSYEDVEVISGTYNDVEIFGRLEGNYAGESVYEYGRALSGRSRMELDIPSNNEGIMLRRLYSMSNVNQKAYVYVDDVKVGVWENKYNRGNDEIVRFDDFIIPEQYTTGKSKIIVELRTADGYVFDETYYKVLALGYNLSSSDNTGFDRDNDGIIDLYDNEIIISSNNFIAQFEFADTNGVEVSYIGSTLTLTQKQEVLSIIGNEEYKVVQSFGVNVKKDDEIVTFSNSFEIKIPTSVTGNALVVYFDDYGSINIISCIVVDGMIVFDIYTGGQFLVIQ